METKKKLEVIFSLFIGVLFISSYAVFANPNGSSSNSKAKSTNSTNSTAQTIYITTTSNALITNYTGTTSIDVVCTNKNLTVYNATSSNITSILTKLESNNSVSTFYPSQQQFYIDLGSFTPLSLYSFVSNGIPKTEATCLRFNATAELTIPAYVNFTITSSTGSHQQIPIAIPSSSRSIYLNVSIPPSSLFTPVLLRALVYQNGSIYQLSVTQTGA